MARKKYKERKLSAEALKKELFNLFKRHSKKSYSPKQIINKLKISSSKDAVSFAIAQLVKEGKVYPLNEGKFRLDRFAEKDERLAKVTYEGTVDMTRSGSAYVVVYGQADDFFVPGKFLKNAMNGDKVRISVTSSPSKRRPEAKVKEVIERSITQVVGIFRELNNYGVVMVKQRNFEFEINVKFNDFNDAKDGQAVLAKVTSWGNSQNKTIWGSILEVMPDIDDNDWAMRSIVVNNGFELTFPDEVIKESEALNMEIPEHELMARRDFRGITTFTIDPVTAKDFDDALSYKKLDDDIIEIGVHIADVSHFVKSGTALDKEAFNRSTSVYLVDRCIPMLPEKLSNNLCSLRPNEDRFCFSAVFKFDKKFKIIDRWFGKSIIHSDRRFAYEEAQEIMEDGKGEFYEELTIMNTIAKSLRKEKFKNGAISFESEELQFVLDDKNKAIGLKVKTRKDAHLLVEDFMLLANRAVAEFISIKSKEHEIPFVYRIHDEPDQEKLNEFASFASEFGFDMKLDTPKQVADSFYRLHEATKKDESLKLLEPLAIRTMSKAVYSTDNIGHYGLAFKDYTHFTSPIRRYSDVLVHRLLEKNIYSAFRTEKAKLEAQCAYISGQERKATTAERESIKYKQVEYMQERIGEEFEGIISGMIEKGVFIEIKETKAEGFIPFSKFSESFVEMGSRYKVRGKKSGAILQIGQSLQVKLVAVNLDAKQIDLDLVKQE